MKASYIFNTWIATIAGGPLLASLYVTVFPQGGDAMMAWALFMPALMAGLFLSLPALSVYLLVFALLKRKKAGSLPVKISLAVLSVLLIALTFRIIGGSVAPWLALFYSAAHLLAVAAFSCKRSV